MKRWGWSLCILVGLVGITLLIWRGGDARKEPQTSQQERTKTQRSTGASRTGDKSTVQDSTPEGATSATPGVRVPMDLPFETDADFMIGGESGISAGPIDADPTASTYDPPVNPTGSVRSLKLYGKDIPLASTALNGGLLATVGFGEIEVLSKGFRGGSPILEYRAFPADIDKLKKAYPNTAAIKEANEARAKADKGDPEGQTDLGLCYSLGNGVTKDSREAVKWYRKAAEQNSDKAQMLLALCYLKGDGVTKDDAEALKWFHIATKESSAQAQLHIARCYENGDGVGKDAVEAARWSRKAAEQNDAQAQLHVALCYQNGDGVAKDAAEAVRWCRKAADQNNAEAQVLLATYCLKGDGVPKDAVEAVKWCRKAAEQNNAMGQVLLACCYLGEGGVEKDEVEAYKWLVLAAGQGDKEAKEVMASVGSKLSRDQIAEANKRANAWLEQKKTPSAD